MFSGKCAIKLKDKPHICQLQIIITHIQIIITHNFLDRLYLDSLYLDTLSDPGSSNHNKSNCDCYSHNE
jgi:hypothetical protein